MMDYRFLPPEQVQLIATRSRDWLITLQKRTQGEAHFAQKHALYLLVGLWLCEKGLLADQECPYTRQQVQQVYQFLTSHASTHPDALYADPLLVLLSTGIMRSFDVQHETLEAFAQSISTLLQEHSDASIEEANELFPTRFLLHRLQRHPSLSTYTLREMPATALLQADETVVKALTTDITAVTRYGQSKLALDTPFMHAVRAFLPIIMLDYFRVYNLEMGMHLLRCMAYLRHSDHRSVATGLHFLATQQHLDGRFGFFTHEISRLPGSSEHSKQREEDFKIYLPHTVSFLWTLADVTNPDFSLCTSF